MSEYTFNDLIANPETPDLENLIGKEVYYSNTPLRCVAQANENIGVSTLRAIRKGDYFPFLVETSNGKDSLNYACFSCIIPKKEEPKLEPKYVPFKDAKEFIRAYKDAPGCLDEEDSYLFKHGIWLKEKGTDFDIFCVVVELWKDGVFVGHADVTIDGDSAFADFIPWSKLCQGYTFLDGSPCGKIVEEDKCQ